MAKNTQALESDTLRMESQNVILSECLLEFYFSSPQVIIKQLKNIFIGI